MPIHGYSGGAWQEVDTPYAFSGGSLITPSKVHAYGYGKDGWGWYEVWPNDGGGTTPPGEYILSPYSQSWPTSSNTGWALFHTERFRGRITKVSARISWSSLGSPNSNVSGRPSGTFYRSIARDSGWANRTITHDLGATAVSQHNSGAAYGYTILSQESFPGPIGFYVNAARLTIAVSS